VKPPSDVTVPLSGAEAPLLQLWALPSELESDAAPIRDLVSSNESPTRLVFECSFGVDVPRIRGVPVIEGPVETVACKDRRFGEGEEAKGLDTDSGGLLGGEAFAFNSFPFRKV